MKTNSFLFEASWEVCNKVGGIYTVITTKLPQVLGEFGENYFAVGPWVAGMDRQGFTEENPPAILEETFRILKNEHQIFLHFGTWTAERASAPVILVDFSSFAAKNNYFKTKYWELYQLDSLGTDFFDYDTPLIWSTAIGLMIETFAQSTGGNFPVNLHAHEWMSTGSILYLKSLNLKNINTVFTTHATALGRALTARNLFHEDLLKISDDIALARECGVLAKHLTEKVAAKISDSFTTVSTITAKECEYLLGTKPQVVENALDLDNFPDFISLCRKQAESRNFLNNYLKEYFAPWYDFQPEESVIQFTMGRYEFHNKGYDLHLEALAKLNEKLKKDNASRSVVALFLIPADFLPQLTQKQNHQAPPVCPYELRHPESDPIITKSLSLGLANSIEDKVKVIFIPTYLNGNDGLFDHHLYEIIAGCDLGVFPSAYEPWGYTPMESLIFGIPAVTSALAGFGEAVSKISQLPLEGAFVLKREINNDDKTVSKLVEFMEQIMLENCRIISDRKYSAYKLAESFDWAEIYPKYSKLYI